MGNCPKDAPLNSRQVAEWIAFHNVHPFGDAREDLRSALNRQTLAATHGAKLSLDKFLIPDCLGETKKLNTRLAFIAWAQAANRAKQ